MKANCIVKGYFINDNPYETHLWLLCFNDLTGTGSKLSRNRFIICRGSCFEQNLDVMHEESSLQLEIIRNCLSKALFSVVTINRCNSKLLVYILILAFYLKTKQQHTLNHTEHSGIVAACFTWLMLYLEVLLNQRAVGT